MKGELRYQALRKLDAIEDERTNGKSPLQPDFIARLGHELRTPLTAILGYTEILRLQAKEILPAAQYRQLEIIDQSGHAMLRLISDVLDWSRLNSGRVKHTPRAFPLKETFQNYIDAMLVMAAERGLGFSLRFEEDCPESFVSDPDLLRQVFANLAGNALKYSDRGGVTVWVGCNETELRFSVQDTGPGIPVEEQHRVFEEFHRITPGKKEGTGLGLAITRGLIDVLGGSIQLESEPGNGCRFEVRVPALQSEEATDDESLFLPFENAQQLAHILVVDDEPDNLNLIESFLEAEGMRVSVVTGGHEALRSAVSLVPDLILMDMMMPGLDGFETTKLLRKSSATRDIPIIGLTALTGEAEREALDAGCNLCLTKPLDFRQLHAAIQRCLANASQTPG